MTNATYELRFLGAKDQVTGSRTLLTFRGRRFLIDCGLFQGAKEIRDRNWGKFPVEPGSIEAVLLTHAHLDHSGYLPRFQREGFRGPVHCSEGTADLLRILLIDSAHLEEEHAEYANRTGYSNHKPAAPLFTTDDAQLALELVVRHPRDTWIDLGGGVQARFLRAGHITGASMVQFHLDDERGGTTLTFSGDLGHERSSVLKGPGTLPETDVLILESTYGDRLHPRTNPLEELAAVAERTFRRNGVLVIPAFAVGRAQELIYLFRLLEDQGRIRGVPVVLDSPMASSAMEIFLAHPEDHALESAFLGPGDNFRPSLLEISESPNDSLFHCMREGPLTVISASGMLAGGRILHHLKRRLPDPANTVVFTGYQAETSKGRYLQDNAGKIEALRIHHEEIPVRAEITTIDSLSAHADYEDLIAWLARATRLPRQILLNHGSEASQRAFATRLEARFPIPVSAACDLEGFAWPLTRRQA